jgi:hypothetical protein
VDPTHQAGQAAELLQLLHVPNQDQQPTTTSLLQQQSTSKPTLPAIYANLFCRQWATTI